MSYSELENIIKLIEDEFTDMIDIIEIGNTFLGKPMKAIKLTLSNQTKSSPAVLLTGAHHARELTSISMNIYTILRLLYEYENNDPVVTQLLNNHIFYFIPVVN